MTTLTGMGEAKQEPVPILEEIRMIKIREKEYADSLHKLFGRVRELEITVHGTTGEEDEGPTCVPRSSKVNRALE